MSNPNSPEARKLAKELSDLRKLQKASHIAPRLPYSSVPEGNLVVTDSEGNVVDVVGPKGNPESGDQLILPGREPSKPSAPIVSAYLGTITATWDGTYTEDYVAPDLLQIEVHSSTDDDFEASAGTLIGTITGQRGGSVTLAVDYGTHYVRFVAVSTSGSRSEPSDIASVEVTPLVETIEMQEVLDDIDARYDGVITEAQQLNDKLDQAAQDLATHEQRLADAEADLTNLNDVELVQLKASVDQAKLDLAQAQTDVDNALAGLELTETDLANLKNIALPALQGNISDAQNRLDTAEDEITASNTRLSEAESDLTDAFGQITAVDSKASTAITNASTAQSTADTAKTDAATAAGIANGKGKVLVQSTAPGVADRNAVTLWIDTTGGANTPKRWTSGTTWVAVTDKAATDAAQAAATAQSRADAAHSAAGTAQSTADNALTMAGSKSKVYYSTSNPSGTASVGDTWRKVNSSQDVIGEWRWSAGNTWVSQQITNEMISNLDVGKITASTALINTAVVNKIAIQTADVIKLNASAITAGTISADRLNVNDLAAKIATVIQLNADRITAGTIATGRLNATEVAAAVATVIQLNASRITAGTINTDRLNANEIAAKVATVIQLNASRITAGTINTDRLNANEIAAKTAAFQTVDVKNLFATTGTMSEAVINKLWTDVVHSKKITTDMLVVSDTTNAYPDPYFAQGLGWLNSTGGWTYSATLNGGKGAIRYVNNSTGTVYMPTLHDYGIPIIGGAVYWVSAKVAVTSGSSPNVQMRVYTYDSAGTNTNGSAGSPVNITSADNDYIEIGGKFTAPENAVKMQPRISFYTPVGTGESLYISEVRVNRMASGELIVDGAITAEKIKTNAIESDKIKANAITADKIEAGAITAAKIAAGTITADKMIIGLGSNLMPDPTYSNLEISRYSGDGWDTYISGGGIRAFRLRGYSGYFEPFGRSTQAYSGGDTTNWIPCNPGEEYKFTVDTYGSGYTRWRSYATFLLSDGTYSGYYPEYETTHGIKSIEFTIPSNVLKFSIRCYIENPAGGGDFRFYGRNSGLWLKASGELIVDGAIDGKTITGATIQTDKASNVGVKLSNSGIEAYSPQGEKTFSITAGQGVDYIGVWGNVEATVDDAGNIQYPSGVEPEQMVSLDYLGGIAGSELSVSDFARFDGNIIINGEALHETAYGVESPGEFGPIVSGRALVGANIQGHVDRHSGASDRTAWLDAMPLGMITRGYRNMASVSTENRETEILELSFESSKARSYKITVAPWSVYLTGTNAYGHFKIYRIIDDTSGGTTRPVMRDSDLLFTKTVRNETGSSIMMDFGGTYYDLTPTGGNTKYLFTFEASGGKATVYGSAANGGGFRVWVEDMGLIATESGTDRIRTRANGGTTPTTKPADEPAPAPKPKSTYTKTWNASWWATYWVGNGNGVNSGMKSPKVAQGRPPGVGYSQRGAIGFPDMTGTVSGSTIKKVEVYVYAAHWYSSAGGTLEIGTHGHTTKPTTMSSNLVTNRKSQALKKPEGRWVTLPSAVHAGIMSGTVRGIQAYTTSTSLSKYGYLDGKKSKIRITYEK